MNWHPILFLVALDWHDEIYYSELGTEGIIGTKHSRGTNYTYEYASASIISMRLSFVIVVIPVKDRSILGVIRTILEIVNEAGIRIKILFHRCYKLPYVPQYHVYNNEYT